MGSDIHEHDKDYVWCRLMCVHWSQQQKKMKHEVVKRQQRWNSSHKTQYIYRCAHTQPCGAHIKWFKVENMSASNLFPFPMRFFFSTLFAVTAVELMVSDSVASTKYNLASHLYPPTSDISQIANQNYSHTVTNSPINVSKWNRWK